MGKLVKVEGQVRYKDGLSVGIGFYEEEFILDDSIKTEAEARQLIQNGLISDRLRKTVDNFKGWRTCDIVQFDNTEKQPEFSELDKAMMEAMKLNCVPENIDNYRRPDYKLKALQQAIANHKEVQAKKKAQKEQTQDQGYVD